jgi:hypothetical protein
LAKFAGLVGYVTEEETIPGIWSIVEHTVMMRGDIIRAASDNMNDLKVGTSINKIYSDIFLSHRVTLMGDQYAFDNYMRLQWVMINGKKWKASSVEIQRPRLIISIGRLWDGKQN